ncbi:MAG: hypothetical protein DWQ47_04355 [Acidobacteria bacterium]|nr:MAG: hypothetical protein DWQ32_07905 [Acidobacteriota bacterium]REK01624.1 MAG: hypothetical protein DWQ38_04340 [Acidobacteriota bacterium]REK14580.1 MAG: hypothetical protein DWQ43_13595 [Acidobacteriota bacterium]REK45295.1 MAG: hypothetical protein DWQ47_04355 [Acidobacteriota bacterium]
MEPVTRAFSEQFSALSGIWRSLAQRIKFCESGYPDQGDKANNPAEILVRSAAKVEQTFGGINAQMWDDPFEWTLPEALGSKDKLFEYLDEVDDAREQGFARLVADSDLSKVIWTPAGNRTIAALLLETLSSASRMSGLAEAGLRRDTDKT